MVVPAIELRAIEVSSNCTTTWLRIDGYRDRMPTLATKLRVPALRRELVPRARLLEGLSSKSGSVPRLVLIAAPAGFGKTTLLNQWLALETKIADDQPVSVAWVSLDSGDSDVRRFLMDLIESVGRVADGVGADALALLGSTRDLLIEDILASLLNDLDEVDGRTVLALDDYHLADSSEVHQAVTFLLDNLPPRLTIAITTRADPPLPLARLRTRGQLLEVRAADLRFTQDEAESFFNEVMDLDLGPARVAALEARTEGWAAGLQLAALSARAHTKTGVPGAVDEFVDAFSGSHRFVLDYLVEEVLGSQTQEMREFLISTSVLHQMTGDLCDALTGSTGGTESLEALDKGNVFIVPLDDRRQWYRYHHLFADALRARAMSQSPERVAEHHRAASRWYAEQGMLADAFTHASASGDAERTADIFELGLPDLRKRRQDQTLLDWLAVLPEEVVRVRPLLATAFAWSRLVQGDLDGVGEWLDLAESGLSADAAPIAWLTIGRLADVAQERDNTLRMLPATVAVYRASLAQARGQTEDSIAHAQRAQALADPRDHFARGAAAGFLGLAAWARGDLLTAVETFGEAVQQLHAADNVSDELGASVVLASMSLALGRPDEARQIYEQSLKTADQHPGPALSITGDLHVGLADVLREEACLEAAAQHLKEARELGDIASLPENRYRWYAAMAGLLIAEGDLNGADQMLHEAEQRYIPGFFPDVRPIPAAQARVWISQGRFGEARRWAEQHRANDIDQGSYLDEFNQLTLARLLVAEHRTASDSLADHIDRALAILNRIIESVGPARTSSLVEATIVRAMAHHAAANLDDALADIRAAITVGVPVGYRRLFLDEGEPMTDLLRAVLSSATGEAVAEFASLLLAAAEPQRASSIVVAASPGGDALSDRELDVLRMLATELTGPQIARQLFISVNTLRTHTKRIFTKLDVNTRRAAIARAQHLDLL